QRIRHIRNINHPYSSVTIHHPLPRRILAHILYSMRYPRRHTTPIVFFHSSTPHSPFRGFRRAVLWRTFRSGVLYRISRSKPPSRSKSLRARGVLCRTIRLSAFSRYIPAHNPLSALTSSTPPQSAHTGPPYYSRPPSCSLLRTHGKTDHPGPAQSSP